MLLGSVDIDNVRSIGNVVAATRTTELNALHGGRGCGGHRPSLRPL
jgi:hypothetical protein